MERLTYKNYIEEYEVNFEKSSDKNWSIAKVQQIMTDHYILQTNDYLGSYVTCIQFGEFKTKEEAAKRLAEIKGEKDE